MSKTKLLMSGDVELNPGPLTYKKTNSVVRAPTLSILDSRLHQFGLKPLDVGGDGDCFFRAVSHQLYENPNSHGIIRAAGIQFLTENPERFIESNSEHSWIQYLTSMSCQGTWADGIIIQAVADVLTLKIHIIESHPDFAEITLVEGVTAPSLSHIQLPIFIGHLDEFHYVSTEPLMGKCQRISQQQNKQSTVLCKSYENVIPRNSRISGLFDEKWRSFVHLESSKKIQRIFPRPIVLVNAHFRAVVRVYR